MAKKKARRTTAAATDYDADERLADLAEAAGESIIDPDEEIADNAYEVPLFSDTDGRTTRSISQLRLLKIEPGGPVYKGMIPLNSTLDSIGATYGDGHYVIEGLNHLHKVLATKDNIRISLSGTAANTNGKLATASTETDRVERLARVSAVESVEHAKNFTQLVIEQTQAAAERERNFYQASREQMTQMFTALMAMQQQGFQQTITMMTTSHNQSIQSINASAQLRREEPKDQRDMVDMLLQGLQLGRGMQDEGDGTDKPVWQDILGQGFSLLADTRQKAAAAESTPAPTPNPTKPTAVLSRAQKGQIRDALKLYRRVRAEGIDPEVLLARLSGGESPTPEPATPRRPVPVELDDAGDEDDLDDEGDEDELDTEDDDDDDASDGDDAHLA